MSKYLEVAQFTHMKAVAMTMVKTQLFKLKETLDMRTLMMAQM
jgi:hypothetical protein